MLWVLFPHKVYTYIILITNYLLSLSSMSNSSLSLANRSPLDCKWRSSRSLETRTSSSLRAALLPHRAGAHSYTTLLAVLYMQPFKKFLFVYLILTLKKKFYFIHIFLQLCNYVLHASDIVAWRVCFFTDTHGAIKALAVLQSRCRKMIRTTALTRLVF